MSLLTPKSAILTSPFEFTRMFAGLMSRCAMLREWRHARPSRISRATAASLPSENVPLVARAVSRVPPSMYSMRMATSPEGFSKEPWKRTTWGQSVARRRMEVSENARRRMVASALLWMILSA
ncbi:hypothetical protein V8G54_012176 [Vigna mungo]|uniref:Uncharacterized protein n=1 Tax=Vigna mungo TaxID=3915 RepID=A0AAQ3NQM0_VIGMU